MNRFFTALIVLVVAPFAGAQPLTDRVPADAIVYFGWSGTENAPGFAGSHAEALLKESNIPAVFKQVLPQVIERVRKEDAQAADHMRFAYDLLAPLAKYPTAFFFSGVSFEGEQPLPRLGLICRAGADAETIRAKLQGLLDKEGDPNMPLKVTVDGQDVALLIGYSGEPAPLAAAAASALAGSDNFKSSFSKVQSNAVFSVYVDIEKIVALIDKAVQMGDPDDVAQWNELFPKVMDSFGLRGLRRVAASGGFDGKDWMTQAFVDAPAPRTGLLAMLDSPEVSNDLLKAVPTSAELFAAGALDVGKFLTEVNTALGKLNPEWQKVFNQGLGAATMALGRNLQTDVLDPLGSHWLAYSAPEVSGGGLVGLVLVNKVDDAYKAKGGLMSVSLFASNTASSLLAQNDAPVTISGKQVKYGELAINYITSPLITPCWTMQGDYALFGLYPQSVIGAARQLEGKSSILDNADYQKLRTRLGVPKAHGVSYANLPATAPSAYQGVLAVSRLIGVADLFGVPTPPIVIPPYHILAEHLSVAGSVSWTDDAGAHMKAVSPFPGAEVFQGGAGMAPMIGVAALQAGVILPALSKGHASANDVKSMQNLRQLGLAVIVHANDNQGALPGDLNVALQQAGADASVLDSPIGDAPDGVDYVYLAGADVKISKIRNSAQTILIYDAAARSSFKKTPVVFADGHAEVKQPFEIDALVEASTAALEEAKGN